MQKKIWWYLLPAIASIGPLGAFTAADWWKTMQDAALPTASLEVPAGGATALTTASPSAPVLALRSDWFSAAATASGANSQQRLPTIATDSLEDVLRFDVTPGWVLSRWSFVSAGLSQLPLQGYRIGLVTGAAEDDLAGVLTYYFNVRQQVERITFQGTTGDAGKLIRLLASRFGFGRRLLNDPGLFRYEVPEPSGPARSVLEVHMARPNDRTRRFEVKLALERPQAS